jgi:hypothetical protein
LGKKNTSKNQMEMIYLSERERNPFLETKIRKSLDDKLQFITGSLPKFEHLHALVSSQLLSDIEQISNKLRIYLRVALKDAFPILNESTELLTAEIAQLKLSVSAQRDTVDIHRAKILKQTKPIKDSST